MALLNREDVLSVLRPELQEPAGRLYDWLMEHPDELALPLDLSLATARWAVVINLPLVTPGWESTMAFIAGGVSMELAVTA